MCIFRHPQWWGEGRKAFTVSTTLSFPAVLLKLIEENVTCRLRATYHPQMLTFRPQGMFLPLCFGATCLVAVFFAILEAREREGGGELKMEYWKDQNVRKKLPDKNLLMLGSQEKHHADLGPHYPLSHTRATLLRSCRDLQRKIWLSDCS